MAQQKGTSSGGVIAIAAVAFVLGRCSATPDKPVVPTLNTAPLAAASDEPPVFRPVTPRLNEAGAAATLPNAELIVAPAAALMSAPAEEQIVAPAVERVYYRRCADARAAGAAPIHQGEPGYASHLDRNGDGVACE